MLHASMNNTAEVLERTISGYDPCLGEKYWEKWQEIVTKYGMKLQDLSHLVHILAPSLECPEELSEDG